MRRARYADARIGHNIDTRVWITSKAVLRVGAQIHFMIATSNAQRLRQFART